MQPGTVRLAVERPQVAVLKAVESSWVRPVRILWVEEDCDHHPTFRDICKLSAGDTYGFSQLTSCWILVFMGFPLSRLHTAGKH